MTAPYGISKGLADCLPFPFIHFGQFRAVENKQVFPVFFGLKGPIIGARYDLDTIDHDELIGFLISRPTI